MHSLTVFFSIFLSLVAASIVLSANQPANWSNSLESWSIYQKRYLALRCDQSHNSALNICCLPLQVGLDLPPQCSPGNNDVGVVTRTGNIDDFEDDFEDDLEECGDEPLQVPSPTTATHTTAPSGKSTPIIYTGGYLTYYEQKNHIGACEQLHNDSALVGALDSRIFNLKDCGKQIEVSANGKSVIVTIVDNCPTCLNANCTNLSVAAFQKIAPTSVGILPANWRYLS